MTQLQSATETNRRTVEAFLAGTHSPDIADVAIIDETVAAGIVCHGFPGGDPHDRESYKAFFRDFRSAFSDMEFAVTALVADARFVAARWRVEASHTGPFPGPHGIVAPDGRRIAFEGQVLYRLEDGLIAETWLTIDQLGLLAAIGAFDREAA